MRDKVRGRPGGYREWTHTEIGHYAIGGFPLTAEEIKRGVPTVTAIVREEKEGSSLAGPRDPEPTAESRACARRSLALPSPDSLPAATERVRLAGQAAAVKAVALLDAPGTLAGAQPPTFRQAHQRHRECAAYFDSRVLRWARLAWGYAHLLVVKPALNGVEWVTESPLRAVIAALIILVLLKE